MSKTTNEMTKPKDAIQNLLNDRRQNSRTDCSFEVVTVVDGVKKDTVWLNELSTNGACIYCIEGTVIPDQLAITGLVGKEKIDCQVVWKKRQLVGIEFIYQS